MTRIHTTMIQLGLQLMTRIHTTMLTTVKYVTFKLHFFRFINMHKLSKPYARKYVTNISVFLISSNPALQLLPLQNSQIQLLSLMKILNLMLRVSTKITPT